MVIFHEPPPKSCIEYLSTNPMGSIECLVQNGVYSFHLTGTTKGPIVVQMMACVVEVDASNLHIRQILGHASISNVD